MNKKLFKDLVASMTQMNEIVRGERAPSRKFYRNADSMKKLRPKFIRKNPKNISA
jgi:putative transcriptional regulator